MGVQFVPSQKPALPKADAVPYTASPILLALSDLVLLFQKIKYVHGIVWPLIPWGSNELDELYPSFGNLFCNFMHGVLFVLQSAFLLSLPFLFILPAWIIVGWVSTFLIFNSVICKILNGGDRILYSNYPIEPDKHANEQWIFVNGVAVGNHWLQNNIDRLAITFGRSVTGIHNQTAGIIFDLIECIIQRDFCYATRNIRNIHSQLKRILLREEYKKVVLILHSQGGIEGGLVLDWLLAELPRQYTQKLEVYTFGNAANHFNNPRRSGRPVEPQPTSSVAATTGYDVKPADHVESCGKQAAKQANTAVPWIEHYANSGDFVAQWGVLNFTATGNRFMGRVFTRNGYGHQLCQHYLDNIFPLNSKGTGINLDNDFLDSDVFTDYSDNTETRFDLNTSLALTHGIDLGQINTKEELKEERTIKSLQRPTMKQVSRLWKYANGRSPEEFAENQKPYSQKQSYDAMKSMGAYSKANPIDHQDGPLSVSQNGN